LNRLLQETDAATLPGTVGFIHSRTPGKPWDSWAHPFTYEKGEETRFAMVLNGTLGCFQKQRDNRALGLLADELVSQGYEMKSRVESDGKGIHLSTREKIHPSDLRSQYIARAIEDGQDVASATEKMLCTLPGEVVSLCMSVKRSDAIAWGRINYPMHLSFCDHGAYLATVPFAFPSDAGETLLLPALSSGWVWADGYDCKRFSKAPSTVAPITPRIWNAAYERISEAIRNGQTRHFGALFSKEFSSADCTPTNAVTWQVLSELYREGKIRMETKRIPGILDGVTAPECHMLWNE